MSSDTGFQKLKNFFFDKQSLYPVGLGTIVTGILYGAEYLLEKESPCPCDPKLNVRYACISFLVPASVLFLLSLLVSSDAGKIVTCRVSSSAAATCRWECCKNSCNKFHKGHYFLFTFLKVLVPSILWAAILFADGDYYACAYLNETYRAKDCAKESCASKTGVLPYERRELCVRSQMFGGILLVVTLLVLVVLHFLPECLFAKINNRTEGNEPRGIEMTSRNVQEQQPLSPDVE